jgi:hypothetical protein
MTIPRVEPATTTGNQASLPCGDATVDRSSRGPLCYSLVIGRWEPRPPVSPQGHETPALPIAPPKIAPQAGIALGRLRRVLTVAEIRTRRHLREAR